MRSHLTRNVFRQILANEPIIHRGCLRTQVPNLPTHRSSHAPSVLRFERIGSHQCIQRRTFLNFNIFNRRQEPKEANTAPGVDKMMELAKRERMDARLPPVQDVIDAIAQFVAFQKKNRNIHMTDIQAQLVLQSLRYIFSGKVDGVSEGWSFDRLDERQQMLLIDLTNELRFRTKQYGTAHLELARYLHNNLKDPQDRPLDTYIYVLSNVGQTQQARDLLLALEVHVKAASLRLQASSQQHDELEDAHDEIYDTTDVANESGNLLSMWTNVLRGFTREQNSTEVLQTFAMVQERGLANERSVVQVMLDHSLMNDDADAVLRWWKLFREVKDFHGVRKALPYHRLGVYSGKILRWCLQHDEIEMGQEIVRELMRSNPRKKVWDAIFIWAAGTTKSADEIDRMMTVMEQSNANIDRKQWRIVDVVTINDLVEYAISINNPYLAERFIALGTKRNIEPDARTLVLQMDYRLSIKDVDGALIAYKDLQSKDTSSDEDVSAVNRLIVALCHSQRHDFDTIMNVAADLSDRRVEFEPLTISTLSTLHLNRGEEDDALDLLNTHAPGLSSEERQNVQNAVLTFCIDSKTSNSRAWQAYNVLKTVFDEMPRSVRTDLMTSFLDRGRADMAVNIFQSMRAHTRADAIPDIETYVTAFLGLAKLRDLDKLEVVHNLLKLDYNINVTTYLLNALMIGYTACGQPRNALHFWNDIVASREGPTYNSIHAALRACEKAPWGDVRAKEIWEMLRKRNVDLDQSLWTAYVAAIAGSGDAQNTIATMEEVAEQGEMVIDDMAIGSIYNALTGNVKQVEVETYAKERYPEIWRKLEKEYGIEYEEFEGWKTFKIDRKIGP